MTNKSQPLVTLFDSLFIVDKSGSSPMIIPMSPIREFTVTDESVISREIEKVRTTLLAMDLSEVTVCMWEKCSWNQLLAKLPPRKQKRYHSFTHYTWVL